MSNVLINYYIGLLRAALNDEQAEPIPDGVDLAVLTKLADSQSVDAMVYTKLAEVVDRSSDEYKRISDRILRKQYIAETRIAEYELLCEKFMENNVRFMPVKGILLQKVYPQAYYRQMGDVDLLVMPDDFENAEKVAQALGYDVKRTETHHDEWKKGRFLSYEIHRYLVGYSVPEFRKYYEDGWKFAHAHKGTMHLMSLEDLYVYNTAHMTKHFKNGGIGVKAITDIYAFLKLHGNDLDWEYIYGEFDKLGIRSFCQNCEKLAQAWFGDGEMTQLLNELGMYFLTSGSFGNHYNREMYRMSVQARKSNGKGGVVGFLKNSLFPSYGVMTQTYGVLKKYPFLLPIYWAKRLISAAMNKKLGKRVNQMKQIKSNGLDDINKFYSEIGL